MGFPLSLSQPDYEALVFFAKKGVTTQDEALRLETFLKDLEKRNGVERYLLWIQWQEASTPLPPTANFPKVWPPELRFRLELISRPITRADVDAVLEKKATNPVTVVVTSDPAALLGWTPLEAWFAG